MDTQEYNGQKGIYQLKTQLGSGGFGQSWAATVVEIRRDNSWLVESGPELGKMVVIKWANLQPGFSSAENRAFLQNVNAAINSELSALKRLAGLSCVARVYDFGLINLTLADRSSQGAIFLVEEYLTGEDFDDYLLAKFSHDGRESEVFTGISDPQAFLKIAFQLTSALRAVHQRGVIHGDIWQKNIKVTEAGDPRFFDFGASAIRYTPFLRPDTLARRRSDSFVAPERRRGERHGRRSDIYSIGGLFYYMCTGQNPPSSIPDIEELKNAIVSALQEYNPSLIAANCGIADVISRCMRYEKDHRTRDADALLNELRLFSFSDLSSADAGDPAQKCVSCLLEEGGVAEMFSRMLRMDCARLRSRSEDMHEGILEVSGDHEDLVIGMTTYLSVLHEGDIFLARATPRFWAGNMGINGRFLSMIKLVAQRGAIVKHLMLVCEGDRNHMETRLILEAHLRAMIGLSDLGRGALQFLCKPVSAEWRDRVISDRDWETCYAIIGGEVMAVQPVYDRDNVLRTIRFVRDEASTADRRRREMEQELSSALPLESWLRCPRDV